MFKFCAYRNENYKFKAKKIQRGKERVKTFPEGLSDWNDFQFFIFFFYLLVLVSFDYRMTAQSLSKDILTIENNLLHKNFLRNDQRT